MDYCQPMQRRGGKGRGDERGDKERTQLKREEEESKRREYREGESRRKEMREDTKRTGW